LGWVFVGWTGHRPAGWVFRVQNTAERVRYNWEMARERFSYR
jgi:hypothetical protein